MAKRACRVQPMSIEEWESLPLTFGCDVVSRASGLCTRYVQNHPQEFGGRKLGGKWVFSKPQVAKALGICGEVTTNA